MSEEAAFIPGLLGVKAAFIESCVGVSSMCD